MIYFVMRFGFLSMTYRFMVSYITHNAIQPVDSGAGKLDLASSVPKESYAAVFQFFSAILSLHPLYTLLNQISFQSFTFHAQTTVKVTN